MCCKLERKVIKKGTILKSANDNCYLVVKNDSETYQVMALGKNFDRAEVWGTI